MLWNRNSHDSCGLNWSSSHCVVGRRRMRLMAIVIIGIGSIAPTQIWADSVSSRATVPDTISNGSVEGQPHTDQDEKRTVIVIAHGLGGTIESAAQDAAQNALTEVVGSFIDSDKLVEKHAQISDGIRSEAKNISSKSLTQNRFAASGSCQLSHDEFEACNHKPSC